MDTPEKKLNCAGYYGFGGGWEKVESGDHTPDGPFYCNGCPLMAACWDKHRARVKMLVPDITKAFDALTDECKGDSKLLMERWVKTFECGDPYSTIMAGNIEDGMAVRMGNEPRHRGEGTLVFPFMDS